MHQRELPIDAVLPDVVAALQDQHAVVLRAPAGAGKTTRVPPALLRAGTAGERKIVVLQPRRLAARMTAARMAEENGWQLGREVGYQVRFEQQISRATRIAVVTEGILLRQLRRDPFLQDTAVVVFDEFHERNLNSELALGMVRQVQLSVRPELKIVVMSATLDAASISQYLAGCPCVECQGRTFPVNIAYQAPAERRAIDEVAAEAVRRVVTQTPGDVLVFLPGLREIGRTHRRLQEQPPPADVRVLELYGDLPTAEQDAVLRPGAQRKVILATNVAETSVTIEGVTAVVDSGWERQLQFEPRVGLDRLQLTPISRAAADQRAGRAGRTQPGRCLRLWDERSHGARPAYAEPEVRRVDLASTVLQLLSWIEPDLARFPWFETPRPEAIAHALRLLRRLDAVNAQGITPLGQRLADLPLAPRLGRLLIEAERLGCLDEAALVAAMLSERDPLLIARRAGGGPSTADYHSRSDVLDRLQALADFEQRRGDGPGGAIDAHAARQVFRVREQLLRSLRAAQEGAIGTSANAAWQQPTMGAEEALSRSLLAAFPDRLAKRREPGSRRGLMVGGRGVRLANESAVVSGELFLAVDVDGAGAEALVRQAAAIEREWLPEEHLTEQVDVFFDQASERVLARRRTLWEDLVLDESPTALPLTEETARVLAAAAADNWERAFPVDELSVAGYLARVRCLARWLPELQLPLWDDAALRELLPELSLGRRSLAELRAGPWLALLKNRLTREQLRAVEQFAPERLVVPSGRSAALAYEDGRPPVLAVRIQELFGLAETPRIARGRVPVLLHLLAPNQRVQQVTDDLRSFWDNVYPQVRKDLRGRYPKHAWPEDPWNARPGRK